MRSSTSSKTTYPFLTHTVTCFFGSGMNSLARMLNRLDRVLTLTVYAYTSGFEHTCTKRSTEVHIGLKNSYANHRPQMKVLELYEAKGGHGEVVETLTWKPKKCEYNVLPGLINFLMTIVCSLLRQFAVLTFIKSAFRLGESRV